MVNFYVGAYADKNSDGTEDYTFVGWSKNKLAVQMYNIAGRNTGAFFDHYAIFEYHDVSKEQFIYILKVEWNHDISIEWTDDNSYIDIYETIHGDLLSITNNEYNELIQMTDIDYQIGFAVMSTAYKLITDNYITLIRDKKVVEFITFLFKRYIDIFSGSDTNPEKISKNISKLQAFICKVYDDELLQLYM